jgi:hypothetical protein
VTSLAKVRNEAPSLFVSANSNKTYKNKPIDIDSTSGALLRFEIFYPWGLMDNNQACRVKTRKNS